MTANPPDDAFVAYYDSEWLAKADYFRLHRQRFLQTWAFVVRQGLAPGGQVLDIGGIGPVAAYLQTTAPWQAFETKTDLREPLPLPSDDFDLVLCTETIEHIKDKESSAIGDLEAFNYSGALQLLSELARVVRPSGCVVLTTPNANSYITLHKWLHGQLLLMDPAHVREYSPEDLVRVARMAGLRMLGLEVSDSWEAEFDPSLATLKDALEALPALPALQTIARQDNILASFVKANG